MNRLLFFMVLPLLILLCGISYAAEPEKGKMFTVIGNVEMLHGERRFEEIPNREDRIIVFDSESNATQQFIKCLDDAQKNDSTVEITAKIKSIKQRNKNVKNDSGMIFLVFDKLSTCKRINKKDTTATVNTGKTETNDTDKTKGTQSGKSFADDISGTYKNNKKGSVFIVEKSDKDYLITVNSKEGKCSFKSKAKFKNTVVENTYRLEFPTDQEYSMWDMTIDEKYGINVRSRSKPCDAFVDGFHEKETTETKRTGKKGGGFRGNVPKAYY